MSDAYWCDSALHPAAVGDGFVLPVFRADSGRPQPRFLQQYIDDRVIGFERVDLDPDDVILPSNHHRPLFLGDRPLYGFKSRASGLLIGNIFYLRKALTQLQDDYASDSFTSKAIRRFLDEQSTAYDDVSRFFRSGKISQPLSIHIVSDSTGETLDNIAQTCVARLENVEIQRNYWPMVRSIVHLDRILIEIAASPGPILYMVMSPEICTHLEQRANELNLPLVAPLDPVSDMFRKIIGARDREPHR